MISTEAARPEATRCLALAGLCNVEDMSHGVSYIRMTQPIYFIQRTNGTNMCILVSCLPAGKMEIADL